MLELSQVESEHASCNHEEEKEYSKDNCCSHVWASLFSCKKFEHMSISDCLRISEVSSRLNILLGVPYKLNVSVVIEMLLFDWIHSLDDVPVDSGSTRWGSD